MSLLFGEFLILMPWWGRQVYGSSRLWRKYGLVINRQSGLELLLGLSLGVFSVTLLFLIQGWLHWLRWDPLPGSLWRVALEGLLSAFGIAFAEELVFRGWILTELERDYSPQTALWSNSLIFASLHFLKPIAEMQRTLPQFPGLWVLGLALVWAKRSTQPQRLSWPMGLHMGLVWGYYVIQVGQLTESTHQVPAWITGVDGYPLAGLMGIVFMSVVAWGFRRRSQHPIAAKS